MIVTTANSVIERRSAIRDGAEKNILEKNISASSDAPRTTNRMPAPASSRARNNQPRRDKRDVHGWVVLDKPIGMTSTHAVAW
jgi:tRNA pseudouridine55 synthase